jgi:hypothetical protein
MVYLLDEDPELFRDLSTAESVRARAEAIAPVCTLAPGIQGLLINEPESHGHLGLLVIDGLIAQRFSFDHIGTIELVGPGRLIRPWRGPDRVERTVISWEVLAPARIAILDREFAIRVAPWPELVAALIDRGRDRIYSQLVLSAARRAKRVDERVLIALWHFASLWGRVGTEGTIVRLPNITAEILAQIVGARRQSVSTALARLLRDGVVQRRSDGSWLVCYQLPQLEGSNRQPPTSRPL